MSMILDVFSSQDLRVEINLESKPMVVFGMLNNSLLMKLEPANMFLQLLDYTRDDNGEPGLQSDGKMYIITEMADYSLKDYLAARNEHIKNKIQPALKKKKVVICDRFVDSTLSYQVYGKKIKKSFVDHIHKYILQGIKPNITFVLKVSSKSSKLRLKKRKTNEMKHKSSFSSLTSLKISDQLQDQCRPFQKIRFG